MKMVDRKPRKWTRKSGQEKVDKKRKKGRLEIQNDTQKTKNDTKNETLTADLQ